MVDLTPEERKGKKLWKGYFLYRILGDKLGSLKSYDFRGYPKVTVERLRAQFKNVATYHFYDEKVIRDRELEKLDKN